MAMRKGRFDALFRWAVRRSGYEWSDSLVSFLSVEGCRYGVPTTLYPALTAFRHLNQAARRSAARAYLRNR